MNNIDILEELKEWFNNFDLDSIKHKPEEYIQAISTLIAENKELKETIKNNIILVKDENGNYEELNINITDYIPKSKVEEKIEELEKGDKNTFIRGEKILVLQSLLGKE